VKVLQRSQMMLYLFALRVAFAMRDCFVTSPQRSYGYASSMCLALTYRKNHSVCNMVRKVSFKKNLV